MTDTKKIDSILRESGLTPPNIFTLGLTDSTSTRAREYARDNPKCPDTVFIAEGQTSGRGRLGKSFYSAKGQGIYMTLLLHPDTAAEDTASITARTAVAVAEALRRVCSVDAKIKWVNDLCARPCGSEKYKKLAGILTEAETDSDGKIKNLYIGLGINVYKTRLPDEIADIATSIEDVTGKRFPLDDIIAEVIRALLSTQEGDALNKYRQLSLTLGSRVTVRPLCGEEYSAFAADILDDYSLLVERDNGITERIFSGEVSTALPVESTRY